MNIAAAQTRRFAVSPYARRLARERNLPLETFRGSGPGGRILAADVLGFVPAAAPVNKPNIAAPIAAPSVAGASIAAFATSIALSALQQLLTALQSPGNVFDIDDILLRAAAHAFADETGIAGGGDASVALELAGRQAVFTAAPEMTMTSLRTKRLADLAENRDDSGRPAALSLQLLLASNIRPVMMPLLPGRNMRLTVALSTEGDHAECLLVADAARVDEAAVAMWLAALKSSIENPLRLFV